MAVKKITQRGVVSRWQHSLRRRRSEGSPTKYRMEEKKMSTTATSRRAGMVHQREGYLSVPQSSQPFSTCSSRRCGGGFSRGGAFFFSRIFLLIFSLRLLKCRCELFMMVKTKEKCYHLEMEGVLFLAVASIWGEDPRAFLSHDGLAVRHPDGKGELVRFPGAGGASVGWVQDHIISALVAEASPGRRVVREGEDPLFQGCERSGLLGLVRKVAPAPPASRTEPLRAWARENLRGDGIPHGDEDSRAYILSEEEQEHQRWLLRRPEQWQHLRDALGGVSKVSVLMSGVAPPQVLALLCADALDVFDEVTVHLHFRMLMDPYGFHRGDERRSRLSRDMQRTEEQAGGRLHFHDSVHVRYPLAGEVGVLDGARCNVILFLTVDATALMKPDCVFALGGVPRGPAAEEERSFEVACDVLGSMVLGFDREGKVQRGIDYLLQKDSLPGEHQQDWPCFPVVSRHFEATTMARAAFDALRRFDTANDVRFLPIWRVNRPRARLGWCDCPEVTGSDRYLGLDAVREFVKTSRRDEGRPFRVLDVGAGELRPLFVLVLALVAEGVTEIEVRAAENGYQAEKMEALRQTFMQAVVHLFGAQISVHLVLFDANVFQDDQVFIMGMGSWLTGDNKLDLVTLVDFNVDGSPEQLVLEKEWMERACGEDTRVLVQRHGLLRVQREQESNLLFGDRDTVLQLISPPTQ